MILSMLLQMPLVYSDVQSSSNPPPNCAPAVSAEPPIPPPARTFDPTAPYGDELGDAWEMEEVACWRGIWTRRGRSNVWDAYWIHPRGERARAVLKIHNRGHDVVVSRTHSNGSSCRYEGQISGDWWEITGTYRCTWEPQTVLPWRAQIVRLERSEPQLLRTQQARRRVPPVQHYPHQ
jgi:hypothetical protein